MAYININIHASACKHILRTVSTSHYTYHSHPIDFATPYCGSCAAHWHCSREAAPEPEDVRHNHDYDVEMQDCARTMTQMALGGTSSHIPSWNATTTEEVGDGRGEGGGEEGEQCEGEFGQRMPQYHGEYGIVYDSIEPGSPAQRSPECDERGFVKERDGAAAAAAPMWTMEGSSGSSSFAADDVVASFSPVQVQFGDTATALTTCTSTSASAPSISNSSSSNTTTSRAEIRARYRASSERNKMDRMMQHMSDLAITGRQNEHDCTGNGVGGGREQPYHVVWLRERLVQARNWNESLGTVDAEFERMFGFDLLEVEGALELCFEEGFGYPEDSRTRTFRWVR